MSSFQAKITSIVYGSLMVWALSSIAVNNAGAQIKYVYSLDFPLGQKAAYFEWVASVADVLHAPPEIKRIISYENYFGASPHRFIEFEFDDVEAAARYFNRAEVNQVFEDIVNHSLTGRVTVLKLKGEFTKQSRVGELDFPEGTTQHVVLVDDVPWMPCPPTLPTGCEMAVLEGNPQSADLFTVRFRTGAEFVMPPHSHPKEERVTVLQGKMYVAFGVDGTREKAKQFGPGDYYVNARGAVHTVWADEASVIQITGIGPWEAHFVEQ